MAHEVQSTGLQIEEAAAEIHRSLDFDDVPLEIQQESSNKLLEITRTIEAAVGATGNPEVRSEDAHLVLAAINQDNRPDKAEMSRVIPHHAEGNILRLLDEYREWANQQATEIGGFEA